MKRLLNVHVEGKKSRRKNAVNLSRSEEGCRDDGRWEDNAEAL
jgi:hypothetical protein